MPLLDLDAIRGLVETDLVDDALQLLVDDAEADIVRIAGAHDAEAADYPRRKRVQADLVKLAVSYDAAQSVSVGDVSMTRVVYEQERSKLLMRLVSTGWFA